MHLHHKKKNPFTTYIATTIESEQVCVKLEPVLHELGFTKSYNRCSEVLKTDRQLRHHKKEKHMEEKHMEEKHMEEKSEFALGVCKWSPNAPKNSVDKALTDFNADANMKLYCFCSC